MPLNGHCSKLYRAEYLNLNQKDVAAAEFGERLGQDKLRIEDFTSCLSEVGLGTVAVLSPTY